ncbi:MAG TPA: substrate-binding domain-containing protein [Ilumatobacteraceae bacterium]|nr:substrate-binding domain-containing protein [Ilumatobacteraceae bacterium]
MPVAIAALSSFALVAAACGDDDDAAPADTGGTEAPAGTDAPDGTDAPADTGAPAAGENEYGGTLAEGEFGESYIPDPDILAQGLGGGGSLPEEERARNVALATIARASIPVDEDLALKCWNENECDTGTGGELKVGLADGFGGNIARQIFKMEFILQALTYPEIGHIGYTDANLDTQKAISDVRSFAAQDYDVILSFPDAGEALVPAYRAATDEGAQVVTWSSGKVGEPGTDYLTYSGSDICALGHAWGEKFTELLPDGGDIAIILGAPGNPIDPVHEQCLEESLADNIEIVAREGTAWSRQAYLEATSAILAEHDDLDGLVGSYGDAFVGAMRAYEAAGKSMEGLITMHQSDDNPFLCAWKDAGGITKSYTYVGLLLEGRAGMTAAMMKIAGYDVPPQIIFGVQLKEVTNDSCRTDIPPDGSPSSLVPPELQSRMFPE